METINKEIKLRINKLEIEVDDWNIKRNFFWLSNGNESISIKSEELEDLKEIIKRFEESQK
ncbi:MAG: hypothetical protein ACTSQL_01025 [Promethearchaeota archaeon]